jgi:hypothetical protein
LLHGGIGYPRVDGGGTTPDPLIILGEMPVDETTVTPGRGPGGCVVVVVVVVGTTGSRIAYIGL